MDVSLPCGVFNTSYNKDTAIIRTKTHWVWLIGGVSLSFFVPPFLSLHWLSWVIETCVVIVGVLGLYFVTGLCGQISLGQAGFMAVGAYSTAIIMHQLGISYWLALPLSTLITASIAIIFGFPSLRVKGFYLAMATLASQFLIIWLITHPPLNYWTGGHGGLTTPVPKIGKIVFDSYESWFFVVMVFMWLMIFFAKNIARTKLGRAFVAIRDSDLAAEVLGINIFGYKLISFFLAGIYAGVAGSLFAPYITRIAPENFNLEKSIWYLGMLIVGGSGSIVGSILGVVFIRLLLQITVILGPSIYPIPFVGPLLANYLGGIVFGLLIIIFLIFEPRGINHRWETFKASYRLHPFSY
jgi:branched-chain amino acid transport system permease protein